MVGSGGHLIMAYLLGNITVMESLRKDITDVQGAIIDVFSRVGALRYPSWKFPDKVSCDLDLVTLLERYDHVEGDPEFTQHSHVVLLELVIDRLLLLLQSFAGYTETLTTEQAVPPSRVLGPSMSIGLAARKYWSSILKLGTLYQQATSEKRSAHETTLALQATVQAATLENEKQKRSQSQMSSAKANSARSICSQSRSFATSGTLGTQDSCPVNTYIAKDSRTIGCQTFEASLVPCDACASAQASLHEVNNTIIGVCNSQNLPSSLCKFQEVIHDTVGNKLLSAMEMRYWASEQSKDLSRINKHISELMQLVNPLKIQLEASEKEKQEMKERIDGFDRVLQREKEEQQWQMKVSVQRMEENTKENLKIVNKLEKDKDELRKGAAVLEERVSILKEELKSQHSTIRDLELTKEKLLMEMKNNMVDKRDATALEERGRLLTNHLESTGQELRSVTTELEKERARGESLLKHEESLQAKQKALLQQLDSLDQDCEELRTSLGEVEDEKTRLEEQLSLAEKDKHEARSKLEEQREAIEHLQQEKKNLEKSALELNKNISRLERMIQEGKDREKLLVAFPDLHIPTEAHIESSGNIAEDMERQLQANCIRISVLEEENARLRAMLCKLRETAQQGALKVSCT
ncbi:coiled-coil domain-containing protein 157 isoform X2 [Ambystoma mexicanum]|uniref:coiled-coil domain-containing protein 157 isoform X2 n=1 Tax=Ambystoma mexicanum TaxID=8296 RepID=UPI0037E96865